MCSFVDHGVVIVVYAVVGFLLVCCCSLAVSANGCVGRGAATMACSDRCVR